MVGPAYGWLVNGCKKHKAALQQLDSSEEHVVRSPESLVKTSEEIFTWLHNIWQERFCKDVRDDYAGPQCQRTSSCSTTPGMDELRSRRQNHIEQNRRQNAATQCRAPQRHPEEKQASFVTKVHFGDFATSSGRKRTRAWPRGWRVPFSAKTRRTSSTADKVPHGTPTLISRPQKSIPTSRQRVPWRWP